jgi:hypothetical protein
MNHCYLKIPKGQAVRSGILMSSKTRSEDHVGRRGAFFSICLIRTLLLFRDGIVSG